MLLSFKNKTKEVLDFTKVTTAKCVKAKFVETLIFKNNKTEFDL